MPYKNSWQDHGAEQKFWGTLTNQDVEDSNNELFGNYRFDNIQYLIVDCLDVSETLINDTEIEDVAHTDNVAATYKPHLKMAFICNLPALENQLRDYINHSIKIRNQWDIRFFKDPKSAEDWAKS